MAHFLIRPAFWFAVIWLGWLISWIAAAFWSDRNEKRLFTWEVLAYRVLIVIGVILSLHTTARLLGARRLWHVGYAGAYLLAGLTLGGILFAWWGRIHLGRLWSSSITRKKDHHVVDTGPYRFVRHPIYTGILAAVLTTTIAQATPTAILGWLAILWALWLKARIEERFLTVELEPQAYASYRRRVPMLLPFG
ncbi:MAG TPA: isoprenylcysteine carboxylmethyltransferase family protein [Candidatus Binataceae bacterium]|nr:isoprenylcysteine carboxylmethyltransferase family protein [Candidatus Binataceae bacterium]